MTKDETVAFLRNMADQIENMPKNKNGNDGGWDRAIEEEYPGLRGLLTLYRKVTHR